jgi:hypothetical protein
VRQGNVVGTVNGYRLGSPGFESSNSKTLSLLQNRPDWLWGPTSPIFKWVLAFFAEVKQQRHEVDHSSPSTDGVKNKWSYTATPPGCLHGMNRDTFTLHPFSAFLIQQE